MANQNDFLDLYETLGLDPGCGLAEFKHAYRRHVAMLHPDRLYGIQAGDGTVGAAPLPEVIAQYGAAMEFHRQHGRLPGAAISSPRFIATDRSVAHGSRPLRVSPDRPSHASPRRRSKLLVLLAMIATGVLLWDIAPMPRLTEAAPTQVSADDDGDSTDPLMKPVLSIGMSAKDVRAIEGEPQAIHDNRWEYDGSWVRFDHGKVIDWFSSAQRPLKAAARPPEA